MSDHPKISIISTVYNTGPYLRPAVESILAQTFTDRFGQCRQTGADFDHRLALLRVNGRNNAVDHELIVEKVLPEAFTG